MISSLNIEVMASSIRVYGTVTMSVPLRDTDPPLIVVYWAPNPPERRTSFSGSGLPFPSHDIAYSASLNTNCGSAVVSKMTNTFAFTISYPNAYYAALGTVYVKPHVNVQLHQQNSSPGPVLTRIIGEGMPFRLLSYPPAPDTAPRTSPSFYDQRPMEISEGRTQQQILESCGYPPTMNWPKNFWGKCPAHP